MNTTAPALPQLRAHAVENLRALSQAQDAERPALLRSVADALVDARGLFTTREGTPDWQGRTYAYRTWVGETYDEAGLGRNESRTVAQTVRYHVGAALRDRLDPKTLEALGLDVRTPAERRADARHEEAEIARLYLGGEPITTPADVAALVRLALQALRRVDLQAVRSAKVADRRAIAASVAELAAATAELEVVSMTK